MKQDKKRRKIFIFVSFILCAVALILYASAMATQGWFVAECSQTNNDGSTGNIAVGLWDGKLEKITLGTANDILKIVCVDGECMWSCGTTKDDREAQFLAVKNHQSFDTDERCNQEEAEAEAFMVKRMDNNAFNPLYAGEVILNSVGFNGGLPVLEVAESFNIADDVRDLDSTSAPTELPTTAVTEVPKNEPEFMDQGLWLATIVCLGFAMLWAVVGGLFAIINTATTPVEWITGVGGLYVWNVLAVIFNAACVSCWAAQFHLHLTSNVLLYDADANWTTEGQEKFGYSYWLVVVAIFIHIANIIIIYTGTYEPKKKQQLEAPDTKAVNIMLY